MLLFFFRGNIWQNFIEENMQYKMCIIYKTHSSSLPSFVNIPHFVNFRRLSTSSLQPSSLAKFIKISYDFYINIKKYKFQGSKFDNEIFHVNLEEFWKNFRKIQEKF